MRRTAALVCAIGIGFAWLLPMPADAKPTDVTVEASIGGFDPAMVEVKTGATVTWHNIETSDYPVISGHHQVEADGRAFASPRIAPGARWSFTFLKPGSFSYHCVIHPTMSGEIVAKGAAVQLPVNERVAIVEPDPEDQQSWRYEPPDLTVETGTTITWANNGNQDHTVTDSDRAFDSKVLHAGEVFELVMKTPGVYTYNCTPHPWMRGTVRVHSPGEAAPVDNAAPAPTGDVRPPPPARTRSQPAGPKTHFANIVEGTSTDDWGFDPTALSLTVGDTVVWRNTGKLDHTASADDRSFESPTIGPGGTYRRTFPDAGTFAYHCEPHPFMKATIVVSPPGVEPLPVPADTVAPVPDVQAAGDGALAVGERAGRRPSGKWWLLAAAATIGALVTVFLVRQVRIVLE